MLGECCSSEYGGKAMELDYRGLKCPQPVLKLTIAARKIESGTLVDVLADCPTFSTDVKQWCERQGKVLMTCTDVGGGQTKAQIQF